GNIRARFRSTGSNSLGAMQEQIPILLSNVYGRLLHITVRAVRFQCKKSASRRRTLARRIPNSAPERRIWTESDPFEACLFHHVPYLARREALLQFSGHPVERIGAHYVQAALSIDREWKRFHVRSGHFEAPAQAR